MVGQPTRDVGKTVKLTPESTNAVKKYGAQRRERVPDGIVYRTVNRK